MTRLEVLVTLTLSLATLLFLYGPWGPVRVASTPGRLLVDTTPFPDIPAGSADEDLFQWARVEHLLPFDATGEALPERFVPVTHFRAMLAALARGHGVSERALPSAWAVTGTPATNPDALDLQVTQGVCEELFSGLFGGAAPCPRPRSVAYTRREAMEVAKLFQERIRQSGCTNLSVLTSRNYTLLPLSDCDF